MFRDLDAALLTSERIAALPMVMATPGCWLYRGSSTDAPGLSPRAVAVPFPATATGSRPVLGRVYEVVVLRDRPEVRRLAEALVGLEFAIASPGRHATPVSSPSGAACPPTARWLPSR